ncbi:MAG TPA: adenosylcobinamide-phosphate guanylyltransferase [Methanococcaceae archaeon]|uniref:Adenosylcobinamide-phosphate guanylyltransferase n=1 Tax=Methanothermococcus okinawensis TaxID=155863 RepID=A0A832ZK66_9EURY|nr:adenosylcobinamide-phosphate guanylyltransferase [Methanococcaceae archaeon]HIP91679.1 adenosylcobinamide-phosphate guanylyltransferase [Methanothermococcus okinawensis]
MDALLMAGGRGTRLKVKMEKPLLPILKKPMIDYTIHSLLNSKIENIYIAVSHYTKKTKRYLLEHYRDRRVKIIDTPGRGYINDINYSMRYFSEPFIVVPCDIPTLTSKVIDNILQGYNTLRSQYRDLEALCVVVRRDSYPGSSTVVMGDYIPLGINILSPVNRAQVEKLYVLNEPLLNVNRLEDKEIAEAIIRDRRWEI